MVDNDLGQRGLALSGFFVLVISVFALLSIRYLLRASVLGFVLHAVLWFAFRKVRVSLQASEVLVYDGKTLVARHPRIVARAGNAGSWITILKSSESSPARCRDPQPWPRPVNQVSSRPLMTRSGPRREGPTAMLKRSVNSSMFSCCTGPWNGPT